jgi:hypothetical protein
VTQLLQCLRDELVRRDYAAPTIRGDLQIVEVVVVSQDLTPSLFWSNPTFALL